MIDTFLVDTLEELGYPKDFTTNTINGELGKFLEDLSNQFRTESEVQVQKSSTRAGLERAESVEEDVVSLMSSVSTENLSIID